jgi:hypothetical protein
MIGDQSGIPLLFNLPLNAAEFRPVGITRETKDPDPPIDGFLGRADPQEIRRDFMVSSADIICDLI